jgi:hypothetical protein
VLWHDRDQYDQARADAIQTIQSADLSTGEGRLKAKYAQQLLNSLNGQAQQAAPAQAPPQYVPSIGQWCQTINGVTNCWK